MMVVPFSSAHVPSWGNIHHNAVYGMYGVWYTWMVVVLSPNMKHIITSYYGVVWYGR